MNTPWYEKLEMIKLIPNFTPMDTLFITAFQYYENYTNAFEKISFLEMSFLSETKGKRFEMTLKFNNVSALYLSSLGSAYNQVSGFHIEDLKDSGFEKEHRYLVQDYEDNLLSFYCESLEVIEAKESKN